MNVLTATVTESDFDGKDPAAVNDDGVPYLWRWDAIAGPMERLFNKLKPAGGVVLFHYTLAELIYDLAEDEDLIHDTAEDEALILDYAF